MLAWRALRVQPIMRSRDGLTIGGPRPHDGLMRRRTLGSLGLAMAGAIAIVGAHRPAKLVAVQILAFNDFHGYVEAVAGSNGRVRDTDAGGIEYLAAHIARLKATNPNTVVVSAGDNIGGSPLFSSMFHDEPAIESLSAAGLQLSAVGNHEFDEGWWELIRMQRGGCHPIDGCQDSTPFGPARFQYLSANVTLDPKAADPAMLARSGWARTRKGPAALFPPYAVMTAGGVKIGFIGLTLQDVARIVNNPATTLRGLTFAPEADAANAAARELKRQGIRAIVAMIHEGGQVERQDYDGCPNVTGAIMPIVQAMSDDIAVVLSAHTHQAYNCTVGHKLLTSAGSFGRLITDVDLQIDRATDRIVSKHAHNVIVSRDVARDARETRIIMHYRAFSEKVASKPVGTIADEINRAANDAGESALGDVIADSMVDAAMALGTKVDVATINLGGIRADLTRPENAAPAGPITVRYGDAFAVLPFGNMNVVKTITGEELVKVLEQQFDNPAAGQRKILQVSRGFSYTYDSSRPPAQRIDRASLTIDGRPVLPTGMVRFATVDFIWNGGDNFTITAAPNDVVNVGDVLEGFTAYLTKHGPVPPGPRDRIKKR